MKKRSLSVLALVAVIAAGAFVIVVSGGKTNQQPAYGAAPAPAKSGATSPPGNTAIGVRTTSLGRALVDANGRTLYLFEADGPNLSKLPAAGLAEWPPLTTTVKPRATGGATAAAIGTISAAGGKTQVTYNGHPLYYFAGDHNPGDTNGQGLNEFGALWYALTPVGAANTSSGGTSGGGYAAPAGGGY